MCLFKISDALCLALCMGREQNYFFKVFHYAGNNSDGKNSTFITQFHYTYYHHHFSIHILQYLHLLLTVLLKMLNFHKGKHDEATWMVMKQDVTLALG